MGLYSFFSLQTFAILLSFYHSNSSSLPYITEVLDLQLCCVKSYSNCQNLGNGQCDENLNTEECAFDMGDCGYCAPGCNFHMLLNEKCDEACNFGLCDYDYGDCRKRDLQKSCNFNLTVDNELYSYPNCSINEPNSIQFYNITELQGFIIMSNNYTIENASFQIQGNANFLNAELITEGTLDIKGLESSYLMFQNFSFHEKSMISIKNAKNLVRIDEFVLNATFNSLSFSLASNDSYDLLITNLPATLNPCTVSIQNSDNIEISSLSFNKDLLQSSSFFCFSNSNITISTSNLQISSAETSNLFELSSSTLFISNTEITLNSAESFVLYNSNNSSITLSSNVINSAFANSPLSLTNSQFHVFDSIIASCNDNDLVQSMKSNFVQISNTSIPGCSLKDIDKVGDLQICSSSECTGITLPCRDGYINFDGCRKCPDNTYSIQFFKPVTCFDCPLNMTCINNSLIPVNYAYRYYEEQEYLKIVRMCPEPSACPNSTFNASLGLYTTNCEAGYQGRMCHSCTSGYTKTGLHVCSACPSPAVNIFITLGIVVVAGLIAYYMIKTTISTSLQPDKLHSIGLKIGINYIQIIFLCLQYRLSWPSSVHNLSTQSSNESTSSSSFQYYYFSIKCLIDQSLDERTLFYYRVGFMVSLPIIVYIFSWIVILSLKLFTKHSTNVNIFKTVIIIIPFLLIYPYVMSYALSPLACESLQYGKPENFDESVEDYPTYLIENRDIWCDYEHKYKSIGMIIFGVVVWGQAVPFLIFLKIFQNRKNLFDINMKFKYGFLFSGYLHRCYYWEFVILFKKLSIVILTVIMQNDYNPSLQSVLLITVLIIFFFFHISLKPYITNKLNDLEFYSSLAAIITVVAGIVYNDSGNRATLQYVLAVVIFITNILYFCYWLKFMFKKMLNALINSVECLRKRFNKTDGFNEDLSKEFKRVKFIYIKEFQTMYTQVEDEDSDEDDDKYLGYNKDKNELFRDIISTKLDDYKENKGPVALRHYDRKKSIFLTAFGARRMK